MTSGDIVETAADVEGLTKPPLLVLDRVRAFLDEHGLGVGRAPRASHRRGRRLELHVPAAARVELVRPSAPAAPAAASVRARRRARGQAPARRARRRVHPTAHDRRGLRGREPARRPVLRHGVPRRLRPDGRAPAGTRRRARSPLARRRSRRRARRDPRRRRHDARPRGVRSSRELQRASGSALRAALGRQQDARGATGARGRRVARGQRARAVVVDRRARRLPARATRWSPATIRRGSSPCSTGRWARSATRARTSATSSRRTASRAGRRTRSARRRSPRSPGFPSRAELVERYVARSGRDVEPLPWFEALALWKAAVFCEAIYGRFVRGELGAEDTRAARFEEGVPYLAEAAAAAISRRLVAASGCVTPRASRDRAARQASPLQARSRRARAGPRAAASRRAATSHPTRATRRAARRGAPSARRARPRR